MQFMEIIMTKKAIEEYFLDRKNFFSGENGDSFKKFVDTMSGRTNKFLLEFDEFGQKEIFDERDARFKSEHDLISYKKEPDIDFESQIFFCKKAIEDSSYSIEQRVKWYLLLLQLLRKSDKKSLFIYVCRLLRFISENINDVNSGARNNLISIFIKYAKKFNQINKYSHQITLLIKTQLMSKNAAEIRDGILGYRQIKKLLPMSGDEENEIVKNLTSLIHDESKDPDDISNIFQDLEFWQSVLGNQEAILSTQEKHSIFWEIQAKNESGIKRYISLTKSLEIAKKVGFQVQVDKILMLMQKVQEEIGFSPVRGVVGFTSSNMKILSDKLQIFSNLNFKEKIDDLLSTIMATTKKIFDGKLLQSKSGDDFFDQIPVNFVTTDGRVIVKANTDDMKRYYQDVCISFKMGDFLFFEKELIQILEDGSDDLRDYLNENKIYSATSKKMLLKGVKYYKEGDFQVSQTILVLNFERMFRELTQFMNLKTIKLKDHSRDFNQQAILLSSLLSNKEMISIFGGLGSSYAWLLELFKIIFDSEQGMNLRHEIAHSLLNFEDYSAFHCRVALEMLLALFEYF